MREKISVIRRLSLQNTNTSLANPIELRVVEYQSNSIELHHRRIFADTEKISSTTTIRSKSHNTVYKYFSIFLIAFTMFSFFDVDFAHNHVDVNQSKIPFASRKKKKLVDITKHRQCTSCLLASSFNNANKFDFFTELDF